MNSSSIRFRDTVSTLLAALQSGMLSHGSEGDCAITCILGGERAWLDVINPTNGQIDHWTKYNAPRKFAKGLQLITDSSYSIEELIQLEALFEGRVKDERGNLISTLDDENDPGATIGLSALLTGLEAMDAPHQAALAPVKEVGIS